MTKVTHIKNGPNSRGALDGSPTVLEYTVEEQPDGKPTGNTQNVVVTRSDVKSGTTSPKGQKILGFN